MSFFENLIFLWKFIKYVIIVSNCSTTNYNSHYKILQRGDYKIIEAIAM